MIESTNDNSRDGVVVNPSLEQQRIAIAEACGFTRYGQGGLRSGDMREWNHPKGEGWNRLMSQTTELPDFPGSLDAMHEAEKTLTDGQFYRYCHVLLCLTGGLDVDFINDAGWSGTQLTLGCIRESVVASPGCRAEAFLRVHGKWPS